MIPSINVDDKKPSENDSNIFDLKKVTTESNLMNEDTTLKNTQNYIETTTLSTSTATDKEITTSKTFSSSKIPDATTYRNSKDSTIFDNYDADTTPKSQFMKTMKQL